MRDGLAEVESELGRSRALALAMRARTLKAERERQQQPDGAGLMAFVRYFWHILEPVEPFVDGWVLHAIARHLDAVHRGKIQKLLINVPPGSMKSLMTDVFYPAWEWSAGGLPSKRYVAFSYGSHLTTRDNAKFRDLMMSREFQELWGFKFTLDKIGEEKVSNNKTGWKFASSVGGVGTGERGDCVILDDPHSITDADSEQKRPGQVRWFKEAMSNRLNNMERSSIIVIMQRSHEADVSGEIIAEKLGYIHLCIPMEFEADRKCITYVDGKKFWEDPRKVEGECFWPVRFTPRAVEDIYRLGEHVLVGQYQQRPEPRGGGLFKRDYWRWLDLAKTKGKFPKMRFVVASVDTAFTDKKQNDPCGFSVWGSFKDEDGAHAAVCMMAWRKHLRLNGKAKAKPSWQGWEDYRQETEKDWGLMQWLRYECHRWGVDLLLIENKASGHDVVSEFMILSEPDPWAIQLCDTEGLDKWARGTRVQPVFADGLIWIVNRKYASVIIDEAASFPRGKYDDIVDSMSQALWWLRKNRYLVSSDTLLARMKREAETGSYKPSVSVAQEYGVG